jgi:hypothetical protein
MLPDASERLLRQALGTLSPWRLPAGESVTFACLSRIHVKSAKSEMMASCARG